jgi:hypothetical protein
MLTSQVRPLPDYFGQIRLDESQAELRRLHDQLFEADGVQVVEFLCRPREYSADRVIDMGKSIPFVKSEVFETKGSEVDPMSANALAVYQRVNDPVQAVESFGRAIAAGSGLTLDQGKLFALECLATGEAPFFKMQQYHVIEGRLSMRSDAMLAEFNKAGGKHRIIKRTPDEAVIEMSYDGNISQFSFTWAEAVGEPMVYQGKEKENVEKITSGATSQLKLKPKYATPRARMQMLWARVVSDAIRAVMPSVNYGRYTPEEVEDFEDRPVSKSTVFVEANGNGNRHAKLAAPSLTEADDAEFEFPPGQPAVTVVDIPGAESRPEPPTPTHCTELQAKTLRDLRAELEIGNADWLDALNRRGAGSIEALSYEAAREMCNKMQMAASQKRATLAEVEKAASEPSKSNPAATTVYNSGPCTQPQIDKIRQCISNAPTAEIRDRLAVQILQHLHAYGCVNDEGQPKLHCLTVSDADVLERALTNNTMEMFFDLKLRKVDMDELVDTMEANGDTK